MKVIDLLNKIANGEEVPEKIRCYSDLYKIDYCDMDYENQYINDTYLIRDVIHSSEELNNEIEIIEDTPKEDKKIEKISLDDYVEFTTSGDIQRLDYMFNKNTNTFVDKINEIIDKINGEK